jgi:hypothetical protein
LTVPPYSQLAALRIAGVQACRPPYVGVTAVLASAGGTEPCG